MTDETHRIEPGERIHRLGVEAAAMVLSVGGDVGKLAGDPRRSAAIESALQFVAIRALEDNATSDDVLNALSGLVGWALAALVTPEGQWQVFTALTSDMLARSDKHRAAEALATGTPAGTA